MLLILSGRTRAASLRSARRGKCALSVVVGASERTAHAQTEPHPDSLDLHRQAQRIDVAGGPRAAERRERDSRTDLSSPAPAEPARRRQPAPAAHPSLCVPQSDPRTRLRKPLAASRACFLLDGRRAGRAGAGEAPTGAVRARCGGGEGDEMAEEGGRVPVTEMQEVSTVRASRRCRRGEERDRAHLRSLVWAAPARSRRSRSSNQACMAASRGAQSRDFAERACCCARSPTRAGRPRGRGRRAAATRGGRSSGIQVLVACATMTAPAETGGGRAGRASSTLAGGLGKARG